MKWTTKKRDYREVVRANERELESSTTRMTQGDDMFWSFPERTKKGPEGGAYIRVGSVRVIKCS